MTEFSLDSETLTGQSDRLARVASYLDSLAEDLELVRRGGGDAFGKTPTSTSFDDCCTSWRDLLGATAAGVRELAGSGHDLVDDAGEVDLGLSRLADGLDGR